MITWDEPTRLANLARHGIDLAEAEQFGWEDALIVPTHQGSSDPRGSRPSACWANGWLS